MANDNPRLTTADLRRRLLTPSNSSTPVPAEPAEPTAPKPAIPPRLSPDFAEPVEGAQVDEIPIESAPITSNRPTPPEFARPAGRSSHLLRRPAVSGGAQDAVGRSSAYHARPGMPGAQPDPMATRFADNGPMYDPLVEQLQFENEQLRRDTQQFKQLMEEMRQLLQEASEQEQRIQAELTDREAKLKVAEEKTVELQTIIDTKPKTKGELEEWADELERESFQVQQDRRSMDEDRKQLRDDEAALEKQMREMEVQMARERAMLARQETELKRLNAEIQHELDLMQRGDGVLRERLAIFQRRHAEVVGAPVANGTPYGLPTAKVVTSAHPTPPPKKNDTTGLLRKLFRGGE
jgi:hypothetical protein